VKRRRVYMSFSDAMQGVAYAVRMERNMRIHLLLALLVVVFAAALGVTRLELVALILAMGLVFTAELFNTAVEEMVDLVTPDFHPLAGVIKNIAAGGVLVSALTAAGVGYLVFIDYILHLDDLLLRRQLPPSYLMVLIAAAVVLVITGWKAGLARSRPSLHTAAAFALAVAIRETGGRFAALAGFVLALLVAQSRTEGKKDNWWDVGAGALVGSCLALLFLRLIA